MLLAVNWRYWQVRKNSSMYMTVQGRLMQARFIEIHQIFAKKKRSDLVFPHLFHSSVWAMLGHLTLNLFDIQEILQYFWSEFNHFRINVSVSSAISLIVIWWLSNSYFLLFQSKILVIFNSHPSWKCLYHLYMLIVFIEVLPKSIFNICNVVFVSYCIPKTGCNADSLFSFFHK